MTKNEIKEQLMTRVDEIVDVIMKDSVIEIRKERDNIQLFETKRKKLNRIK